MRRFIFQMFFGALALNVMAQAPQKMSYQAVIRDASGNLVIHRQVGMRITILEGALPGTAVYQETQTPTTNENGLVTIQIGGNTGLDAVDWGNGLHYITTETDPSGGSSYTIIGTSQLLSVPYALYAKTAETAKDAATKAYVDQKLKMFSVALQGVQDADGNHYPAVIIGEQCWMAENLKTTKYNDGTAIPLVTDQTAWSNLTTSGYCWYNNDAANKSIYGGLYNGYTVKTNKLCPSGWHVPTYTEFMTLKNYLIANGYNYDGTTSSNKIAKSMAATTRWTSSTYTGTPGNTPATNNSSGFSALPGGLRAYSGVFYYAGNEGYWWTSTLPSTYGNIVSLHYASYGLGEPSGPVTTGMSIRCLKD